MGLFRATGALKPGNPGVTPKPGCFSSGRFDKTAGLPDGFRVSTEIDTLLERIIQRVAHPSARLWLMLCVARLERAEMRSPPRKRGSNWSVAHTYEYSGFPLSPVCTRAGAGMTGVQPLFAHTISFGYALVPVNAVLPASKDTEPSELADSSSRFCTP